MFCISELGGDEYGGADGTSGIAGDEGFHRESSRHGSRCHAAVVLSFRRRERSQGNCPSNSPSALIEPSLGSVEEISVLYIPLVDNRRLSSIFVSCVKTFRMYTYFTYILYRMRDVSYLI